MTVTYDEMEIWIWQILLQMVAILRQLPIHQPELFNKAIKLIRWKIPPKLVIGRRGALVQHALRLFFIDFQRC